MADQIGGGFDKPKVGRGLAVGDFDRDGDLDVLLTTNNGGAFLYRNDMENSNRSIRFRLVGTQSNRDAIGAIVHVFAQGQQQTRVVRSGSSYLSQSELPATFGAGKLEQIERVVIDWPGGRVEEFKNLRTGKSYQVTESKGIAEEARR